MRTAMNGQGSRVRAARIALPAAAVERRIAVQHLLPVAAKRNTDAIVVARHGGEVADKQRNVSGSFAMAKK